MKNRQRVLTGAILCALSFSTISLPSAMADNKDDKTSASETNDKGNPSVQDLGASLANYDLNDMNYKDYQQPEEVKKNLDILKTYSSLWTEEMDKNLKSQDTSEIKKEDGLQQVLDVINSHPDRFFLKDVKPENKSAALQFIAATEMSYQKSRDSFKDGHQDKHVVSMNGYDFIPQSKESRSYLNGEFHNSGAPLGFLQLVSEYGSESGNMKADFQKLAPGTTPQQIAETVFSTIKSGKSEHTEPVWTDGANNNAEKQKLSKFWKKAAWASAVNFDDKLMNEDIDNFVEGTNAEQKISEFQNLKASFKTGDKNLLNELFTVEDDKANYSEQGKAYLDAAKNIESQKLGSEAAQATAASIVEILPDIKSRLNAGQRLPGAQAVASSDSSDSDKDKDKKNNSQEASGDSKDKPTTTGNKAPEPVSQTKDDKKDKDDESEVKETEKETAQDDKKDKETESSSAKETETSSKNDDRDEDAVPLAGGESSKDDESDAKDETSKEEETEESSSSKETETSSEDKEDVTTGNNTLKSDVSQFTGDVQEVNDIALGQSYKTKTKYGWILRDSVSQSEESVQKVSVKGDVVTIKGFLKIERSGGKSKAVPTDNPLDASWVVVSYNDDEQNYVMNMNAILMGDEMIPVDEDEAGKSNPKNPDNEGADPAEESGAEKAVEKEQEQ